MLCGVLAGLGFSLWVGLTWLQDHLLSPSGFQDTAHAVVTDTTFQADLVDTVLDRATFGLAQEHRTGIDVLDRTIEGVRQRAVDAAGFYLSSPERQGMWTRVVTDTHAANVPLSPEAGSAPEHLVVDVTALGETLDEHVKDTVGFDPGLTDQNLRISVPQANTGGVINVLVALAQWRFVLPWLTGGLALAAVALSPKRWWAVIGVGLAGLLLTGALLAAGLAAAQSVITTSSIEPVAHVMVVEIVGLLRESFVERVVTAMIGAAVVALAGVTGAVVRHYTVTYH